MTHWDGCWRHHHSCALAEILRLQVSLRYTETNGQSIVPRETLTASGPVPCFTQGEIVRSVAIDHPQWDEPVVVPVQRIPGSASWTAPAVDEPPTTLDASEPHR